MSSRRKTVETYLANEATGMPERVKVTVAFDHRTEHGLGIISGPRWEARRVLGEPGMSAWDVTFDGRSTGDLEPNIEAVLIKVHHLGLKETK